MLLDRAHDRLKAFAGGADHYLLRPFGPDEVLARVGAIVPSPAATAEDADVARRFRPVAEAVPAAATGAA